LTESEDWEQSGGTHGLGAKWWNARIGSKVVETHGLGAKWWKARVGSKVVERTGWEQSGGEREKLKARVGSKVVERTGWEQSGGKRGLGA